MKTEVKSLIICLALVSGLTFESVSSKSITLNKVKPQKDSSLHFNEFLLISKKINSISKYSDRTLAFSKIMDIHDDLLALESQLDTFSIEVLREYLKKQLMKSVLLRGKMYAKREPVIELD